MNGTSEKQLGLWSNRGTFTCTLGTFTAHSACGGTVAPSRARCFAALLLCCFSSPDLTTLHCSLKTASRKMRLDKRVNVRREEPRSKLELWPSSLHHTLLLLLLYLLPLLEQTPRVTPSFAPLFPLLAPSLPAVPDCVAFGKLANCVLLTWVHVLSGDQLFV